MANPCAECGTALVELFTSRYCPVCEPDDEEITLEYDMDDLLFRSPDACDHPEENLYEYDGKWWCRPCGTFIRDA